MVSFVHPADTPVGLDRDAFVFHKSTGNTLGPIWPQDDLWKFCGGYLTPEQLTPVFGPLTPEQVDAFSRRPPEVEASLARVANHRKRILLPDTGVSIKDMFDRFGAGSFGESFLNDCDELGVLTVTEQPTWRLMQRKGNGAFWRTEEYSVRSIVYAMQLFWLLQDISISANAYHYRATERFGNSDCVHLLHEQGAVHTIRAYD